MIVKVYYESGKISSYSTTDFVSPDPFKSNTERGSENLLSEINFRLDKLEEEGLTIDITWYNLLDSGNVASDPAYSQDMPIAEREPGRKIVLAEPTEIKNIVKIVVDGETVAWREFDPETNETLIINGLKFNTLDKIYNNGSANSTVEKIRMLYEVLETIYPGLEPEKICRLFGYRWSIYKQATVITEKMMETDANKNVTRALMEHQKLQTIDTATTDSALPDSPYFK